MDSSLHEFGEQSPPNANVESTIKHPQDRRSVIGHVAYDAERDERVAFLPRDSDEHYFRKYGGYAISWSVLDRLAEQDVDTICIVEKNKMRRVIEFQRQQFKDGDFVAYDAESNTIVETETDYLNNQSQYNDPQQVLPIADSIHIWAQSEVSVTR